MTYDPEYRLRHAVAEAIVEPSDYVTRSALRSAEAIIRLLRADEQLLAILCHGHPAEGVQPDAPSRSVQRRVAAQRGGPAPEFDGPSEERT